MATMMNPRDPGESQRLSVLLSRYIDRKVGAEEGVGCRMKAQLLHESVHNAGCGNVEVFRVGFDGTSTDVSSDTDVMFVDKLVVVLLPGQSIPVDSMHKTVLYIKDTDCPPGYRFLQLGHLGENYNGWLTKSLVSVGDTKFVGSEMYRSQTVDIVKGYTTRMEAISKQSVSPLAATARSLDVIVCLKWDSWPWEAYEWTTRTRLYGWPSRKLVDRIMHDGCELLPIGDNNSVDPFLLWKISFAAAERSLVHSLTNIQWKVYLLLKYLLQQIKQTLNEIMGNDDILNSYFMKTAIFFAVENSHQSFWQEQNLFFCFWFCYNILLSWVNSGYCPNFFVQAKNMFSRPVHVQNQAKLFQILNEFHQRKWMCLSVVKFFGPSILEQLSIDRVQHDLLRPQTSESIEWQHDVGIMECLKMDATINSTSKTGMQMCKAVDLLLKSQSEDDECFAYHKTCVTLSTMAMEMYPDCMVATGNKAKYKSLKKCKYLLLPRASIGTDLLYLATFHFHSGSYRKALEICRQAMPNCYFDISALNQRQATRYLREFCGKGFNLYHKLRMTYTPELKLEEQFCLPHFHLEISKCPIGMPLPPLPYAVFLSFLCYHELKDTGGRDAALRDMIVVKYDEQQGGHGHWIVHTLLGICYQTVGDNRRAIKAFMDSISSPAVLQEYNPAKERLDAIQRS
ncbi:uncharacterized protein LOC110455465 [Mizuhopecten yessoensis]|uniref:Cyclic GMP-AMP synthase n=1 Tax=Mizuhopecten yessoensis TaxID=6573 RepID=A0A210R4D8_MIZYE|nr:uncharacterized protein LOC110455465 [Mizuhopecten yessoensis]OWF55815.1 Cyclic GMP-AMP synthase [Mizuhopecten yessoensis]